MKMNSQFFDFWGNYFINIARGQKQVEDMAEWMQQGFTNLNDMAALFRRSYGLTETESEDDSDSRTWQKAIVDFQQTFAQFAGQWGWVSSEEHRKTLDKCEALERRVGEQQHTIERLRELLTQKGMAHNELFKHLQDSMNEQSSQFHELMRKISGTENGE